MALHNAVPRVDPLTISLQSLSRQPVSQQCRLAILNNFWETPNTSVDRSRIAVDTYFEYFDDQCRLALHNWGRHDVSNLSLAHVVAIAKSIQRRRVRAEVEEEVTSAAGELFLDLAPEIVDLTVRLLLMIQIGSFRNVLMPGQGTLPWMDGLLSDSLNAHFSCDNVLKGSVELDKTFTARNIERIAGIRVVWTCNLLDHLRMRDDDSSVALFHQASFLNFQRECDLFPAGLIEETIKTLSLLLPLNDRETKSWFLKQQIELHLDNEAVRCRSLTKDERNIDNFPFWRDRLVILKQAFDEAKPGTLRQAWADRRNPSQWYNFWIAGFLFLALTVALGLIQCVEGALQVYKAYHPG